ncbi:SH3 domain-containing protein [Dankookia sp. GCM10030260]|uniref:SH3 domain-containing protein n=1 Tax=Dankookia sp. GCM10030260 TaxID=3273390 RepID=UPI00361470B9
MTNPIRAALPALLLLLALPAWAQTSLGQPGSLPPPRAAAPAPAPIPTPGPPKPPAKPQATAPAKPDKAAPAKPEKAVPAKAEKPPRPPPTLQQRPGTSNSAKPATPPAARRKAAPAAAAAGAAAGAAAVVLPAKPAAPALPPKPAVGSATGLPLPRFAALGSNQVNLRIGPDLRYKIEWTYQRKDLPVQIVDEHENWRRIRDPDGTEGWVQRPLLTSRRSFLVLGEERALRRRAEDAADPVARLKPGVIGAIRKCEAESPWCEAKVGDYRGWIRRSEIWGVAAEEAIN